MPLQQQKYQQRKEWDYHRDKQKQKQNHQDSHHDVGANAIREDGRQQRCPFAELEASSVASRKEEQMKPSCAKLSGTFEDRGSTLMCPQAFPEAERMTKHSS